MSLADWGRKEITIAESEMPGLMALRQQFGKKAADGARGWLPAHDRADRGAHRDPGELGAEVTWTSCNIYSTQDHAAAAIAAKPASPSTPGRARPRKSTTRCIEMQLRAFRPTRGAKAGRT